MTSGNEYADTIPKKQWMKKRLSQEQETLKAAFCIKTLKTLNKENVVCYSDQLKNY